MEGEILIDKKKLEEYARKKNYNLGQAEKDYYQEILLFILYKHFGKTLIFKGGTALTKCFGLNRFSEDLDFVALEEKEFSKIINTGLKEFYIEFEFEQKNHKESIDLTYWIKGPLYNDQKNSLCKILLDISLRDKNILETVTKQIGFLIDEIPVFGVVVLSEEEILLEKIRTILQRNKARDLYDLYYLSLRKILINRNNIEIKTGKKFDFKEFVLKLEEKKKIWDSELRPLVKSYPSFDEVIKQVTGFLEKVK